MKIRPGDILEVTKGTWAGQTGRVIRVNSIGVHLILPGERYPVFVPLSHVRSAVRHAS